MGISTGGAVPEGADAVVPLELVEDSGDAVQIETAVAAGDNVRPRGSDVPAGETILEPGTLLGPVTSVTRAPRRAASSASANPMRPLARLPM